MDDRSCRSPEASRVPARIPYRNPDARSAGRYGGFPHVISIPSIFPVTESFDVAYVNGNWSPPYWRSHAGAESARLSEFKIRVRPFRGGEKRQRAVKYYSSVDIGMRKLVDEIVDRAARLRDAERKSCLERRARVPHRVGLARGVRVGVAQKRTKSREAARPTSATDSFVAG